MISCEIVCLTLSSLRNNVWRHSFHVTKNVQQPSLTLGSRWLAISACWLMSLLCGSTGWASCGDYLWDGHQPMSHGDSAAVVMESSDADGFYVVLSWPKPKPCDGPACGQSKAKIAALPVTTEPTGGASLHCIVTLRSWGQESDGASQFRPLDDRPFIKFVPSDRLRPPIAL